MDQKEILLLLLFIGCLSLEQEPKIKKHHSVHWGLNPPLKNTTPLFLAKPPLNQQTVQAPPFLGNPPTPSILVFRFYYGNLSREFFEDR